MSSDSEQEAETLKARLKARLRKAGVYDDTSSDEEVNPGRQKAASKVFKHRLNGKPSNPKGFNPSGKSGSRSVCNGTKSPCSSDSEDFTSKSKHRVLRALESDKSDSDSSSVFQPRASSNRRHNISSESNEDDAEGEGSEDESSEEDSDVIGSDEQVDEESDSDACSLIDKEAEEVECSESGSADLEGPGDLISSSDSEWESDWVSEAEDLPRSSKLQHSSSSKKDMASSSGVAFSSGFASDSSNGTSEKCPICLKSFSDQEVGTPESCDHVFCAECLEQWSKNVNTCPIDRQEFTLILVRCRFGGKIVRQITAEKAEAKEEEQEDPTYCEVCGNCDREDRMLLCDGCDLGYHMECLNPPLTHVPLGSWYCSECDLNTNSVIAEEVDFGIDEVNELLDDARTVGTPRARRPPVNPRPTRLSRTRMLPRTRQYERVLNEIQHAFLERNEAAQPSTSSGMGSQNGETRKRKRKTVRRKTAAKKRRKTTSKTKAKQTLKKRTSTSASKQASSKKTVRKKRKVKRKLSSKSKRLKRSSRKGTRTAKVLAPHSVKGRLAEQLGMKPLRQPWQTTPELRSTPSVSGIVLERSRAGIPTLHIFGQRDELDYFSGSDEEGGIGVGGGVAVVAQPRETLSLAQRLINRKRLTAALNHPIRRSRVVEPVVPAGVNLVDSILLSQTKMLSKKTDVKINIDGSLNIIMKDPAVKPTSSDPLKERLGENPIDIRNVSPSATGHIVQAPMYTGGRRGGHNAQNSFSGSNYSAGRRGRGGGGGRGSSGAGDSGSGAPVNSSGFRSSFNNPDNTRAQYEQFLGNNYGGGRPHQRSQPLRFRLNAPRRPLRRNVMRRRGALPTDNDDEEEQDVLDSVLGSGARDTGKDTEEGGDGPKDEEEVDIYSDIEAESHKEGSGEDGDPEFGALLPPPEPPAILMNMGDQNSDEEGSDSELVIDDRAKGQSDETDEKYDPAEPCDDSGDGIAPIPRADEIPLPPEPGPALTGVVGYSDDSQSEEDPHAKETVVESEKSTQGTPKDLQVNDQSDVKSLKEEDEKQILSESDVKKTDAVGVEESSEDDDEDDDCPNFSIYSATSVNIARQVGEEESDDDKQKKSNVSVDKQSKSDCDEPSVSTSIPNDKKDEVKLADSSSETADLNGEDSEKKASEDSLLQVDIEKSEKKALEDSTDRDESEDSGSDEAVSNKGQVQNLVEEIFGTDEDSQATSSAPPAPVMPGLEGLETEIISDGEEAMLDEDLSEPESDPGSRRRRKDSDGADFEDGEIVDESQRGRKERKKARKDVDENADDEKRKSRRRRDSPSKERPPLSSSENKSRDKDKEKEKEKDKKKARDEDKTKDRGKDDISWKKPSKSTKDRNYRDGKEKEKGKDKDKDRDKGKEDKRDEERENGRKDRKKKEKRKDLERYDVRKVLSDKTLSRQNKDAFGRDLDIRRRSRSHSRSKSRSRSRGRARTRSRSRSHRRIPRSRTKSRSRGRSPVRPRPRNRSASYERSRPRKSRSRSRLRRSRSRQRAGNRSRSLRRSLNRSKERQRKSRSRDRTRRRSRENRLDTRNNREARDALHQRERDLPSRLRNEPVNSVARETRRERELVRAESWSRSFSRSISPSRSFSQSMSGSPQYPMSEEEVLPTRSYSRSWSRERVDHVSTTDMAGGKHKTHKNLTVIVTNNKDDSRRKKKDGKRGGRRHASPAPSKEVFASGDNILVSVNFKSNKSGDVAANSYPSEKSSKRKRDEGRSKRSKKDKGNRATRADTPPLDSSKPAEKRRKPLPPEALQKPVAIIDLEQSPYKEFTPSPKDLIILSDSDDENMQQSEQELQQMKQKLHEEINAVPEEPSLAMGPKTPPEPQVKFSISAKSTMRTINNPLMEEEEEEEGGEEEETGSAEAGTVRSEGDVEGMHKGPNTPPESPMGPVTPGSSPTSPDAYDPFEPTASPRSESPDDGAGVGDRANLLEKSNDPLENGSLGVQIEDESRPKTDTIDDTHSASPKLDGEALSPGTTAPEADEVDKSKLMSPSSSAEAAAVKTPLKAIVAAGGSTEVTSSTSLSTSRMIPQRAVSQSDRLLASVIKGALSVRPASKPGTPVKTIPRQNGEPSVQTDVIDMDMDSPYSPGSSEGDDLFEPPPVYSSKGTPSKSAPRPKATSGNASKTEKFDTLFGSSPLQRVKYGSTNRSKSAGKNAGRNQAKLSRIVKQMARNRKDGAMRTTDEDQLKILDEVPSSAVELQVKDKFLKKLNRQERVVEEVKLALKPHYYKKHINKEDYKEILRRSVPKICHNKSGEINPMKIQTLVEAYVKKIRYLKKKAALASGQLKPKTAKKQAD